MYLSACLLEVVRKCSTLYSVLSIGKNLHSVLEIRTLPSAFFIYCNVGLSKVRNINHSTSFPFNAPVDYDRRQLRLSGENIVLKKEVGQT